MKSYGLIKGRHRMPCDAYIFDEIKDPLNFADLSAHVHTWAENEGLNAYDPYSTPKQKVRIYVTGLSSALIAVLQVLTEYGINAELMHYNTQTQEYVYQVWESPIPTPYGY